MPRAYHIVRDALWCCGLQCADQRDRYPEFCAMVQEEIVAKARPGLWSSAFFHRACTTEHPPGVLLVEKTHWDRARFEGPGKGL